MNDITILLFHLAIVTNRYT